MSFRKTILIDHIAMMGGNILSAEKALDLVFLGWVPQAVRKTVHSWPGLVNKERQKRREGRLHRDNPLPAMLIFTERRSVVLFFDVKRISHKPSQRERFYLKIQSLVWNLWSLSFSLSPLLQNVGIESKDSHSRTVLCTGNSAKPSCSQAHHFLAIGIWNFSL